MELFVLMFIYIRFILIYFAKKLFCITSLIIQDTEIIYCVHLLRKSPANCSNSLTSSSGSLSRFAKDALKSIINAILPVVMTACLSKRDIALVRAKIVLRACRNTCPGIGDRLLRFI